MKKIKFFECCHFVKGVNRAIICDLQRGQYIFVPLALVELFTQFDKYSVEEIKKNFPVSDHEYIDEYLDFLVKEEFIFFTNTPDLFPRISTEWDEPYVISNMIVDIDKIDHPWDKIMETITSLGCRHLQIRCFSVKKIEYLVKILYVFFESRIASIELIVKWDGMLGEKDIIELFESSQRLFTLIIHSCKDNAVLESSRKKYGNIQLTKQVIDSSSHCGIISQDLFSINNGTYFESVNYNSCLNRKISIDVNGDLKNCPSMMQSFGNINEVSIQEALGKQDFKKYWHIKKDDIEVCKKCEFKYICTDCRAYIENPKDIYSKPLKCGYNPQTCEWEEWSTNPLKQKAIEYYGLQSIL